VASRQTAVVEEEEGHVASLLRQCNSNYRWQNRSTHQFTIDTADDEASLREIMIAVA